MMKAVAKVKALPNYAASGEVRPDHIYVELSDKCKSPTWKSQTQLKYSVFRQKYQSSSVLLHEELCPVSNKA